MLVADPSATEIRDPMTDNLVRPDTSHVEVGIVERTDEVKRMVTCIRVTLTGAA